MIVGIGGSIVGYYSWPDSLENIFYIIITGGLVSCVTLLLMPLHGPKEIDDGAQDEENDHRVNDDDDKDDDDKSERATGGLRGFFQSLHNLNQSLHSVLDESQVDHASSRNLKMGEKPASITSVLKNKDLLMYGGSAFFFHLGNAGILPLL